MDKELALRTFGYLIGHYKTHDETIINSQEIEAIEFMLKDNDKLERQVKNQKEVIDRAINDLNIIIDIVREQPLGSDCWIIDRLEANKSILKEVSE